MATTKRRGRVSAEALISGDAAVVDEPEHDPH
jgi:hypothetical protein